MEILEQYNLLWVTGVVLSLIVTGIIAGLLAGLIGVGGGIVIVPVLYHLFTLLEINADIRMYLAVGTSLATIIPTSIISARSHYLRGSLDLPLLKSIGPSVFFGATLGGLAGSLLKSEFLNGVFAFIALFVAIDMTLRSKSNTIRATLPGGLGRTIIGTAIGSISSIMGIGGGTIGVPVLSAFNTPIHRAIGTASALGFVIGIPGAVGFLITGIGVPDRLPGSIGYVNLVGFACIVPFTTKFAPVGARIAHNVNARKLKLGFSAFLIGTSAKMFMDLMN